MSIRALYSAATGMDALQTRLDVTANNMANSGTTAFKRSRVNFEDIYYQRLKLPGLQDQSQGLYTPTGIAVGLGTRVNSTQLDFRQGSIVDTGNNLDVAIVGEGFFQVQDSSQVMYTRAGNFSVNSDGTLVTTSADIGRPLIPTMTFPTDATDISITEDGTVYYMQPGQTTATQLGQIQLAKFINPAGLLQKGENLFAESSGSGSPIQSTPGQDGIGTIKQGFLEASNVEPVRELVELITTQRNFEFDGQVIQAADQMLQLVANLRRY